jgi:Domain of unknown function (DUF4105)
MKQHMQRLLLILLTIHYSLLTFSQSDSCELRISLITCSPGAELYSTFGHSALRIVDKSTGTDIIYNYGVFDFYDPDFYAKFVRGKLLYFLDQENFADFFYNYSADNRSVSEQVLNLSCTEKKEMQQFLFINLRPENKQYKYDFLFDNCTTRLRDLVLTKSGEKYQTAEILSNKKTSFRNHIHYYLDMNNMNWSKLGIDLLLGAKLDRYMNNTEAMFLPDYLEKGFDSSRTTMQLVEQKIPLYIRKDSAEINHFSFTAPGFIFSLLLIVVAALSFFSFKGSTTILALTDFLLFLITGLLGILLVFMWTGTDHQICSNNYNLLWALPSHLFAAFFIRTKSPLAKKYFLFSAITSTMLLISWYFLPQALNPAFIPLVILIGWRSWRIAIGNK